MTRRVFLRILAALALAGAFPAAYFASPRPQRRPATLSHWREDPRRLVAVFSDGDEIPMPIGVTYYRQEGGIYHVQLVMPGYYRYGEYIAVDADKADVRDLAQWFTACAANWHRNHPEHNRPAQ